MDNHSLNETADTISLRIADTKDADRINSIMAQTYENLDNKDLFVTNPPQWVERILNNPREGFAVVGEMDDEVVSFFFIWYPGDDPENLGLDIDLPPEELCLVAHAETTCVLPKARGNHLERRMIAYAESFIDPSQHKYLMATISPDNPASYKSAEANGYKHIKTKEKYGGVLRRIYMKEL